LIFRHFPPLRMHRFTTTSSSKRKYNIILNIQTNNPLSPLYIMHIRHEQLSNNEQPFVATLYYYTNKLSNNELLTLNNDAVYRPLAILIYSDHCTCTASQQVKLLPKKKKKDLLAKPREMEKNQFKAFNIIIYE